MHLDYLKILKIVRPHFQFIRVTVAVLVSLVCVL